jgi:hypothetical protein
VRSYSFVESARGSFAKSEADGRSALKKASAATAPMVPRATPAMRKAARIEGRTASLPRMPLPRGRRSF